MSSYAHCSLCNIPIEEAMGVTEEGAGAVDCIVCNACLARAAACAACLERWEATSEELPVVGFPAFCGTATGLLFFGEGLIGFVVDMLCGAWVVCCEGIGFFVSESALAGGSRLEGVPGCTFVEIDEGLVSRWVVASIVWVRTFIAGGRLGSFHSKRLQTRIT